MRLRNRSHYQVVEALKVILGFELRYRVTVWRDPEWTYLDVQPSPQGDDYVALARWAEVSCIRLDRVGGRFPLRRFEVTPRDALTGKAMSLMATAQELEKLGASEYDVNRVAELEVGQVFEPGDKAFTVRRAT